MMKYSTRVLDPYGMLDREDAEMRVERSTRTREIMERVAEMLPSSLVYGSSQYGLHTSDVTVINIAGKDRQKEMDKVVGILARDVKADYKDVFIVCSDL